MGGGKLQLESSMASRSVGGARYYSSALSTSPSITVQAQAKARDPVEPDPHRVKFQRKPKSEQSITFPWRYEPGHLVYEQDESSGRMYIEKILHDVQLEAWPDEEQGDSANLNGEFI